MLLAVPMSTVLCIAHLAVGHAVQPPGGWPHEKGLPVGNAFRYIPPTQERPLAKVFDDVLPDKLIEKLQAETHTYSEKMESYTKLLHGGKKTTVWYNTVTDRPPRNFIESTVNGLRQLVEQNMASFGLGPDIKIKGGEWWTQRTDPSMSLRFHYDKDERMVNQHWTMSFPVLSTITYLDDIGAPTLILNQTHVNNLRGFDVEEGEEDGVVEDRPLVPESGLLIYPKKGRHVIFRGDLQHGTMSSMIKQRGKTRVTMLINWWMEAPLEPNTQILSKKLAKKYSLLYPSDVDSWLSNTAERKKDETEFWAIKSQPQEQLPGEASTLQQDEKQGDDTKQKRKTKKKKVDLAAAIAGIRKTAVAENTEACTCRLCAARCMVLTPNLVLPTVLPASTNKSAAVGEGDAHASSNDAAAAAEKQETTNEKQEQEQSWWLGGVMNWFGVSGVKHKIKPNQINEIRVDGGTGFFFESPHLSALDNHGYYRFQFQRMCVAQWSPDKRIDEPGLGQADDLLNCYGNVLMMDDGKVKRGTARNEPPMEVIERLIHSDEPKVVVFGPKKDLQRVRSFVLPLAWRYYEPASVAKGSRDKAIVHVKFAIGQADVETMDREDSYEWLEVMKYAGIDPQLAAQESVAVIFESTESLTKIDKVVPMKDTGRALNGKSLYAFVENYLTTKRGKVQEAFESARIGGSTGSGEIEKKEGTLPPKKKGAGSSEKKKKRRQTTTDL